MQDKWISVKDRLPENGNGVLVGRFNKKLAFYSIGIDNYMGYGKWWDKDYNEDVWSITHWMPLPADPKIEMQEVKHGKWIFIKTYYEADECNCSLCGQVMTTAKDVRMNYCSNCGAKMDGDVE